MISKFQLGLFLSLLLLVHTCFLVGCFFCSFNYQVFLVEGVISIESYTFLMHVLALSIIELTQFRYADPCSLLVKSLLLLCFIEIQLWIKTKFFSFIFSILGLCLLKKLVLTKNQGILVFILFAKSLRLWVCSIVMDFFFLLF